jgi:hypothetical protein
MDSGVHFEEHVLTELLNNIGSVAGAFHVVPADFVTRVIRSGGSDDDEVIQKAGFRVWRQVLLTNDSFLELFVDYDKTHLYFRIENKSPAPIGQFALAINKNAVGLTIADQPRLPAHWSLEM